ncbi:hypothetical protein E2C01_036119 [Portunus trituberculatus]|uniref:Uncharacterized protein n=1 Tax=Portunus trituberculatus TaxID=210409 RepID=A0A5B7FAC7_PORTR|nr:hypothetical protein [Portunus trituberculatus]
MLVVLVLVVLVVLVLVVLFPRSLEPRAGRTLDPKYQVFLEPLIRSIPLLYKEEVGSVWLLSSSRPAVCGTSSPRLLQAPSPRIKDSNPRNRRVKSSRAVDLKGAERTKKKHFQLLINVTPS